MQFCSLYSNNQLSQSTNYSNFKKLKNRNSKNNKIKVNRVFSPTFNMKNSDINNSIITSKNLQKKNNNKSTNNNKKNDIFELKLKKLQNSISSVSLNNYGNFNHIKFINININLDKIKIIQKWWKYIYKIIFIQKNIRAFIIYKKSKYKLKYIYFIYYIIKIYFNKFINKMKLYYLRYFLKKWNEITYKNIIFNRLFLGSKSSKSGKQIFSEKNSIRHGLFKNNTNEILISGNDSKNAFSNSNSISCQNKIFSPSNVNLKVNKPLNFQINIKKRKNKNIACNIYNDDKNNFFNKTLTNKSKQRLKNINFKTYISDNNSNISNNNSKKKNKMASRVIKENKSLPIDKKNKVVTNFLYQNIKEYYNINEITINPTFSSNNFYSTKFNKNKNLKIDIIQNNINRLNKPKKITKLTINNRIHKRTMTNYNESFKIYNKDKIIHLNTFENAKTTKNKNNYKKILKNNVISPIFSINRDKKRKCSKSMEFNNNDDIHIVLLLIKVKKYFIHWRNIMTKKKIIKKLRLISKINHIFYVYKIIYIKIFFVKLLHCVYNSAFCLNIIDNNTKLLKCYYNKLKEISKSKIINDFYLNNHQKSKNFFRIKNIEKKTIKSNNNKNMKADELYYTTQNIPKYNRIISDKNKNNNIIIINNNINNNVQQLLREMNKNKNLIKRGYSNSMIEIQTLTDTSISYGNRSDKNLNSLNTNNLLYNRRNKLVTDINNIDNKKMNLYSLINLIQKVKSRKELKRYINKWKSKVKNKSMNYINEKIIHFPKSPSTHHSINYIGSKINYSYINNALKRNNNIGINYFKTNDLNIKTVLTDNNIDNFIKNPRNLFGSVIFYDTALSPYNKYLFYTDKNESNNNSNDISKKNNKKIIYRKKVLPLSVKNSENNKYRIKKRNSIIFDYNYERDEKFRKNSVSLNNYNINNFKDGNNLISNFYTSNNFFNKKNSCNLDNINHLNNMNELLPEEKYGFKKVNKIEEREINFSPKISKRVFSFCNENLSQSINQNNSIKNFSNKNFYTDTLNSIGNNNILNNFPINHTLVEDSNFKKVMNHSQSQGFKRTIRNFL